MPQQFRDTEDIDSVINSMLHDTAEPGSTKESDYGPAKTRKNGSTRRFNKLLTVLIFILLSSTVVFLVYDKENQLISDTSASPFAGRVDDVRYPLYYPTKLPEGFKIDLNSINHPEDSEAVAYKLTNDTDKQIFITLQAKPANIDLTDIESKYLEPREITTLFGPVKVGKLNDSLEIANILTERTWIIVNAAVKTITDEEFNQLIISLEEAK